MSKWLPIESAPKDGAAFLAWGIDYKWPEVIRWFDYDDETAAEAGAPGYFHFAEDILQNVTDAPDDLTHWQPLPEPPA